MLVIQHRANNIHDPVYTDVGEIDVHIDSEGSMVVKHHLEDCGWELEFYLERATHKKFFVDIKQNLRVKDYVRIINAVGDRLIGLFDVPMPAGYFLARSGISFYARLSEIERPTTLTDKFWLDPLINWSPESYDVISNSIFVDKLKTIVACPSLHGRDAIECRTLWRWLKDNRFKGIVTKHPKEFMEIFNG